MSEAMFGILITLFVCVVLCVASLTFSSDANALVLKPVEACATDDTSACVPLYAVHCVVHEAFKGCKHVV
eukprot:6295800-Amphidinium_carterae.1